MRLEEREMDICEYLEHPFENALLLDVRSHRGRRRPDESGIL